MGGEGILEYQLAQLTAGDADIVSVVPELAKEFCLSLSPANYYQFYSSPASCYHFYSSPATCCPFYSSRSTTTARFYLFSATAPSTTDATSLLIYM